MAVESVDMQAVDIQVNDEVTVSGLWQLPHAARACLVLAHGAGAGMRHPFMTAVAEELAQRAVATLRYQFPYTERRAGRPDAPELCHATVRAAVSAAAALAPALPRFAGGKSFGGRMSSQAQAAAALPGVLGLVFLGFPLHAPGRVSNARGEHLMSVRVPMLFLQGTRDRFADPTVLQPLIGRLGARATLKLFDAADHSFHVPARVKGLGPPIYAALADAIAEWISTISAAQAH